MRIRRVLALCLALCVATAASPLAQKAQKDEKKRNKQEQQDMEALVKLVDGVSMGQQQAPADIPVTWDSSNFFKGEGDSTYIPFTVVVDKSTVSTPGVAIYVRALAKGATTATPTGTGGKNDKDKKGDKDFPWANFHFAQVPADNKLSRAMMLPGGDYEVFVAVKEATTGDKKQAPAKMTVIRQDLQVPDFKSAELNTSSVVVVSAVEPAAAVTKEDQSENPYTFGTMRLVPSPQAKFAKSGQFKAVFWIYGVTPDAASKPDVQVEYNFHQKTAEGEKFFNKTPPQVLNASTLPPEFSFAAGHQLPESVEVPLSSFPAGDYRLEIKITDKPSGKTLTRNVAFTVVEG